MSTKHGVRMPRLSLACLALLLMGSLSTPPISAQVSGGALPGVTVTLENVETGLTRDGLKWVF